MSPILQGVQGLRLSLPVRWSEQITSHLRAEIEARWVDSQGMDLAWVAALQAEVKETAPEPLERWAILLFERFKGRVPALRCFRLTIAHLLPAVERWFWEWHDEG